MLAFTFTFKPRAHMREAAVDSFCIEVSPSPPESRGVDIHVVATTRARTDACSILRNSSQGISMRKIRLAEEKQKAPESQRFQGRDGS